MFRRQSDSRAPSKLASQWLFGRAAQTILVATCHEGKTCRRAHGRIRVRVREAHALRRHAVE